MTFKVIDNTTGKEPDFENIFGEEWTDDLVTCDIDQFAVTEDGHLILIDDCDNLVYCPDGRYTIVETTDENKCDYNRTNMNVENMKELMYYRKAIKLLKEDDSSREVWYAKAKNRHKRDTRCIVGTTI